MESFAGMRSETSGRRVIADLVMDHNWDIVDTVKTESHLSINCLQIRRSLFHFVFAINIRQSHLNNKSNLKKCSAYERPENDQRRGQSANETIESTNACQITIAKFVIDRWEEFKAFIVRHFCGMTTIPNHSFGVPVFQIPVEFESSAMMSGIPRISTQLQICFEWIIKIRIAFQSLCDSDCRTPYINAFIEPLVICLTLFNSFFENNDGMQTKNGVWSEYLWKAEVNWN